MGPKLVVSDIFDQTLSYIFHFRYVDMDLPLRYDVCFLFCPPDSFIDPGALAATVIVSCLCNIHTDTLRQGSVGIRL